MTEQTRTAEYSNLISEMAFSVAGSRKLNLTADWPAEKLCEFLAYQVSRQPTDLLSHVQRINLAIRYQLGPYLTGALVDLNIALGARGYDLRKCMLDLATPSLKEEFVQYLLGKLDQGIAARDPVSEPGVSVLSRGISGHTNLVEVEEHADLSQLNPLEEAMAYIESSQLDAAREVLESAIYKGVSDAEQQDLLLSLYRKTDDQMNFSVLYSNIDDETKYAQDAWHGLAEHFGISR